MAVEIAHVGDICHGIEADVALDGQVELMAALELLVTVDGAGCGGSDDRVRSGLRNACDSAVVQRRRIDYWRRAAAGHVIGRAIVEDAARSADHHLAVPLGIPRETETRRKTQIRKRVEVALAGEAVDIHAVDGITGAGDDRTDQRRERGLAGERIHRYRLAVQRALPV